MKSETRTGFKSVWYFYSCLSFCPQGRGAVSGRHLPRQTTPLADTLPRQTCPPGQTPLLADTPLGRHPSGQTSPLGRHTSRQTLPPRYGHCSRRYASYWNAFLFHIRSLSSRENGYARNIFANKLFLLQTICDFRGRILKFVKITDPLSLRPCPPCSGWIIYKMIVNYWADPSCVVTL